MTTSNNKTIDIRNLLLLRQIARELEAAPRMGAEKDDPEGVRFVQMSDTVANEIARTLFDASAEVEDLLPEGVGL
jgi:hypothetical protein